MSDSALSFDETEVREATLRWLERAVIGLNLCPFAKGVHVKGQIRTVLSAARDEAALLDDLERELRHLVDTPAEQTDTTLIVVPAMLADFDDFLGFLDLADVVLRTHGLSGVLQIASFHPDFVFADGEDGDIAHCTNRSPYPTLHLIREASLARAVAAFPDAADIYERNIATLRRLGAAGWAALDVGARPGKPEH